LALALVATGCAGSYPHLSFKVEQRLLRETTLDDLPEGQAQPGDAVVRIIRAGRGACSGALIGPHQVLTAQHCMMRVDIHNEQTQLALLPGDMHVEFGGSYLPWGRVGIIGIHSCEGYHDDVEHDVSVVMLSKDVPEIQPFAISFSVPERADMFDVTGFGTDNKPRAIPGFGAILSVTRHLNSGPLYAATDAAMIFPIPGAPGDSGGPIVDADSGKIVSVASRGRTHGDPDEAAGDPGGPFVARPRLITCKKAIETALAE
jgi:Trypsin